MNRFWRLSGGFRVLADSWALWSMAGPRHMLPFQELQGEKSLPMEELAVWVQVVLKILSVPECCGALGVSVLILRAVKRSPP